MSKNYDLLSSKSKSIFDNSQMSRLQTKEELGEMNKTNSSKRRTLCCVRNCGNRSERVFKFPSDPVKARKWLLAIGQLISE